MLIDIGVLEGSRAFQGYCMIVFGGLVALLLAFRPRGLLDERLVHRLSSTIEKKINPGPPARRLIAMAHPGVALPWSASHNAAYVTPRAVL